MTREEAIEYARTWYKPTVMLLECDMGVIEALCSEDSRLALAHRRIELLRAELLWFADCDNSADWIRADAALDADDALAKEQERPSLKSKQQRRFTPNETFR